MLLSGPQLSEITRYLIESRANRVCHMAILPCISPCYQGSGPTETGSPVTASTAKNQTLEKTIHAAGAGEATRERHLPLETISGRDHGLSPKS